MAGDILYALASEPEKFRQVGRPEAFISFSEAECTEAEMLKNELESSGIRCFFANRSIHFGTEWPSEIRHAIQVCRAFVPLVTPDWSKSWWCQYEFGGASVLNKPIFPVMLRDVEMPIPLSKSQGLRVSSRRKFEDVKRIPKWGDFLKDLKQVCKASGNEPA